MRAAPKALEPHFAGNVGLLALLFLCFVWSDHCVNYQMDCAEIQFQIQSSHWLKNVHTIPKSMYNVHVRDGDTVDLKWCECLKIFIR
jgi:hypothetical protein